MSTQTFDMSILDGVLSVKSIAMYKRDFQAYEKFAGDDVFSVDSFSKWRDFMVKGTKYSPNTINRMLSAVRSVLREACARGLLDKSIYNDFTFVRSIPERPLKNRLRKNARTKISPEDMRLICDHPTPDTLIGLRDRALLLTMATSGARINEVVTLTRDHIGRDKNGCHVMVNGKIDTNWRRAPLSNEAYERIQAWLDARPVDSEYVFTAFDGRGYRATDRCMSVVAAFSVVKTCSKAVGVEHVKPHDFRRFVATQLCKRNPRQAQLALGHTNIASTYKYYVLDELEFGVTDDIV
jgi:integrase/recombinase XerD